MLSKILLFLSVVLAFLYLIWLCLTSTNDKKIKKLFMDTIMIGVSVSLIIMSFIYRNQMLPVAVWSTEEMENDSKQLKDINGPIEKNTDVHDIDADINEAEKNLENVKDANNNENLSNEVIDEEDIVGTKDEDYVDIKESVDSKRQINQVTGVASAEPEPSNSDLVEAFPATETEPGDSLLTDPDSTVNIPIELPVNSEESAGEKLDNDNIENIPE